MTDLILCCEMTAVRHWDDWADAEAAEAKISRIKLDAFQANIIASPLTDIRAGAESLIDGAERRRL
jgi:hypothetical protein